MAFFDPLMSSVLVVVLVTTEVVLIMLLEVVGTTVDAAIADVAIVVDDNIIVLLGSRLEDDFVYIGKFVIELLVNIGVNVVTLNAVMLLLEVTNTRYDISK